MDFIPKEIIDYCELNSSEEDSDLKELNRYTNLNVLNSRMISGHLQGKTLEMLSLILQPKYILEIGTYTGYSAICLAKGLQSEGKLITIDKNEELEDIVKEFVNKFNYNNKIKMMIGDAKTIIPNLEYKWDLVFIDADKENYLEYYNLVISNVRPGGVIIVDNVLWSGKVVSNIEDKDLVTNLIVQFNKAIKDDSRVENVLLPIRDGLNIIRKI